MFHQAIRAGLPGAQVLSYALFLQLTFRVSVLAYAAVGRTLGTPKL